MRNKVFTLSIGIENDAFARNPGPELARILREIAQELSELTPNCERRPGYPEVGNLPNGGWLGHYQTIFDIDGNDVGRYAVKET